MDDGPLLCTAAEKLEREAANSAEQLQYIDYLVRGEARELRESHVLELHKLAVAGVYPCGGRYRTALHRVHIEGSNHTIPPPAAIPALVAELCCRANAGSSGQLHRAAYVLWRLNWIHPFAGGNGRTARACAFLVLCMDLGQCLPGATPTFPTYIAEQKDDYIAALRSADTLDANDEPNLQDMKMLVGKAAIAQLDAAIAQLRDRVV